MHKYSVDLHASKRQLFLILKLEWFKTCSLEFWFKKKKVVSKIEGCRLKKPFAPPNDMLKVTWKKSLQKTWYLWKFKHTKHFYKNASFCNFKTEAGVNVLNGLRSAHFCYFHYGHLSYFFFFLYNFFTSVWLLQNRQVARRFYYFTSEKPHK